MIKKEMKLSKPVETYSGQSMPVMLMRFCPALPMMPSSKTWGGRFAAALLGSRNKSGLRPFRRIHYYRGNTEKMFMQTNKW